MFTCELEKLAYEYDQQYNLNLMILNKAKNLITLWRINKECFIIVSNSSKKPNYYQLTYFNKNIPTYDIQRDNYKDIAHELIINDATIEVINYIH